MNTKELKALPYPLFKITLTEAYILTEARKYLGGKARQWIILCGAIDEVVRGGAATEAQEKNLSQKIKKSLSGMSTLSGFQGANGGANAVQRRKIWIQKLLKHNGY